MVLGGRVVVELVPWDGAGLLGVTPGGLLVVVLVVVVLVLVVVPGGGEVAELEGLGFCLSTSWR